MAYESTRQMMNELSHHWYKRGDGNFYKLLDAFNTEMERASDTSERIVAWHDLDQAEGTTLDLLGGDIKTYRINDSDVDYRFMIRLKQLLSRAQGTIPSIVKIVGTALESSDGIKIWNTENPRHVGIKVPLESVRNNEIQQFLLNNLKHMLALGYWLDVIVFRTETKLPLYLGIGTQDRTTQTMRSKTLWWSGWTAKTENPIYVGIHTTMQKASHESSKTLWWDGWKAQNKTVSYLACVGQVAKTQMWHTTTSWADTIKQDINAGLTVGNLLLDSTTQILKTE